MFKSNQQFQTLANQIEELFINFVHKPTEEKKKCHSQISDLFKYESNDDFFGTIKNELDKMKYYKTEATRKDKTCLNKF